MVTYPAYEMLYQLVKPSWKVFEYGCGNSSLWWSTHASEVVSVEHNINWANHVRAQRRANLQVLDKPRGVIYAPLPAEIALAFRFLTDRQVVHESAAVNEEHGLNCPDFVGYVATLMDWPRGYFDAIVIDGMARSLAAYLAGLWVKPTGIVVFDNSDRWQYGQAWRHCGGWALPGFDAAERAALELRSLTILSASRSWTTLSELPPWANS